MGWLHAVLVCLGLGIGTELLARLLNFWRYRSSWLLASNIGGVFGLFFGSLLWLLDREGVLLQFIAGAGFGLAYESANFAFLNAWQFPDNRLLMLRGQTALTVGVGLAWGFILPLASLLLHLLPPVKS
jgi:hypothetical protein